MQELSFILDTGSAWLWVPGEACPNPQQCSGTVYLNSKSETYVNTKEVVDITYGVGYLEGHISTDQVALLPNPAPNEVAQGL